MLSKIGLHFYYAKSTLFFEDIFSWELNSEFFLLALSFVFFLLIFIVCFWLCSLIIFDITSLVCFLPSSYNIGCTSISPENFFFRLLYFYYFIRIFNFCDLLIPFSSVGIISIPSKSLSSEIKNDSCFFTSPRNFDFRFFLKLTDLSFFLPFSSSLSKDSKRESSSRESFTFSSSIFWILAGFALLSLISRN